MARPLDPARSGARARKRRRARPLWLALGWTAVAAASAGVVLPLVPTTPFLLVAAFAFARSSPRMHRWLLRHKRFGPLITHWRRYGAIRPRVKLMSLALMAATPPVSWALGAPSWVVLVQIAVLIGPAIFVATRPHGPPAAQSTSERPAP